MIESPTLPAEGGCRCGRLRFRISAPPLLTTACHCRGCQRMTGSAYALSAAIPAEGFAVIQGEPVVGGLGEPPMHFFCGQCMSWVFTRPPGMDFLVNVRASLLDDPAWFTPFVETQTAEKLVFAETGALHSYPRWPEDAQWPQLIAAYQKMQSRTGQGPALLPS